MKNKLKHLILLGAFILPVALHAEEQSSETYGKGPNVFSLATGSPGELGLIRKLADDFTARTNTTLRWVKAGSGESFDLLRKKQVDMIMVHAPAAEKKALAEGWATQHTLIGSNEFFIVGPADDPAGIAAAKGVAEAYARIATKKAKFFSRGDNSGTHKKELDIWKKAGISPAGDWYVVTKDFMIATLRRANAERGYFMTDSSTWVAERKNMPNLKILFRGTGSSSTRIPPCANPTERRPELPGRRGSSISSPHGRGSGSSASSASVNTAKDFTMTRLMQNNTSKRMRPDMNGMKSGIMGHAPLQ